MLLVGWSAWTTSVWFPAWARSLLSLPKLSFVDTILRLCPSQLMRVKMALLLMQKSFRWWQCLIRYSLLPTSWEISVATSTSPETSGLALNKSIERIGSQQGGRSRGGHDKRWRSWSVLTVGWSSLKARNVTVQKWSFCCCFVRPLPVNIHLIHNFRMPSFSRVLVQNGPNSRDGYSVMNSTSTIILRCTGSDQL